jgi:single-strand DNA-binding protein
MSVNKVILLGRLGKDPEIRMTQSGKQQCRFPLATSEVWVKDGKREEKTEWHNIVMWEKTAELAGKYLKKGGQVYLEGKNTTRSWEQDGKKNFITEVVVNHMTFLGGNSGGQSQAPAQGSRPGSQESSYAGSDFGSDDDVPF